MHAKWLIAPVLVLAGCGATDVESSSEYQELVDERDALAAELDELRTRLDQVDDELAVANARRDDAEEQAAAGDAVAADLEDLLVLDVMNRVGLSSGDAGCVVDAFVADESVRQAYLALIDPARTDAVEMEEAYGEVTAVMADCGLDVGRPDPEAAAEARAALDEVLGEIEVVGAALPRLVDGAPDAAVGVAAPVIVGADYTGASVTIDAAADGPTMVVVLAHWCPHCNEEIPKLNQLRDEGRIPDGVNVVAVSSGVDPSRGNFPPDEWLTAVDWTFPIVADGLDDAGSFAASGAFGTTGFPFVTLIDGDGNVVARWAGERDIDDLAAALDELAVTG